MKFNFKGYISSRKLNDGNHIPQKVQNIVIRSSCADRNFSFIFSATEYGMKESFLILNQLLNDLKNNKYDGIAFYSLDQLPNKLSKTKNILETIIKHKKKVFFSLENILIENKKNLENLLNILKIKKVVS